MMLARSRYGRRLAIVVGIAFIVSLASGVNAQRSAASAATIVATGQILDAQQGFVFFTTGDGFRIDRDAPILDYHTKLPTTDKVHPRLYARATFDSSNGHIRKLELSRTPLPVQGDLSALKNFAVASSPVQPNPDLGATTQLSTRSSPTSPLSREPLNGKPVLVTFTVQVPPNTPFTDSVYMSTDLSGWNPQAIRMDRVDALHYRVVRKLSSGTILYYRYTRGSQATAERAQNGLEGEARRLEILNLDVKDKDDVVYHWGDESIGGQVGNPLAIPTPYNPSPFGNLPQNPHRPQPTPPH